MSKPARGPKRQVRRHAEYGGLHTLALECGHEVLRRIKSRRRRRNDIERVQDPSPTWVYCHLCAKDGAK